MNIKQMLSLDEMAVMAWIDDFAPSTGAAISYYTVFSLAPLLVVVIAVVGAIFGREAVTGQITEQLAERAHQQGLMPDIVARRP